MPSALQTNTEEMRVEADTIRQSVARFGDAIEALKNDVKEVATICEGEIGRTFQSLYEAHIAPKLEENRATLNEVGTALSKSADTFDEHKEAIVNSMNSIM